MIIPIIIVVTCYYYYYKDPFISLREKVISAHTRLIATLLSIYKQNKTLRTNYYIFVGPPKID